MMEKRIDHLILGGGIAGVTAAETLRELSGATITIVTEDPNPLYSRVRLPDYLLDKIPREKVFIKDFKWYQEKEIDYITETSIKEISVSEKRVLLENGKAIHFKKLLISTGGIARFPEPLPKRLEGIHLFRTIEDADRIREGFKKSKRAVVLGGGYIGLELVRCAIQKGIDCSLVLMDRQFWPGILDEPSSKLIEKELIEKGLRIVFGAQIKEVKGKTRIEEVLLTSGKKCEADFLGVGAGIQTLQPFLESSGIKTGKGIVTDEFLNTGHPDIFAAGDVAEFFDLRQKRHQQLGNWVNAQEQGKTAALNMSGEPKVFDFISNYAIRVFGVSVGFIGDIRRIEGTQVIQRGSPREGVSQLFIREGEVKGAALVNRPHEMRPLLGMIKNRAKVHADDPNLSDSAFDLETLI
ncbi:MAG: NAD(P)/FAD-dependent oxidoreductase [Nitrospirae bacterium]|nr:NAD(P)/FAD-dependent oxidoreductase [Nitrospirota bacterium]